MVSTLDGALDLCRQENAEKVMIIGGGEIFAATMADADVLEVTIVHATLDGDTVFPEIDPDVWEETARERHPRETADGLDYSFVTYNRR